MTTLDPWPQVEVVDFVHLMEDFLNQRIDVHQYRRNYFNLMKKRMALSDEEDKLIQQAYGDADDYEDVVHLAYIIDEAELKRRVSATLEKLRRLGPSQGPQEHT